MDFELFSALFQNLLHVNVLYDRTDHLEDSDIFQKFEEKYCYHPALQPAFQASELKKITADLNEDTIYSLRDDLHIHMAFFLFDHHLFLSGPYVHHEANSELIHNVLMEHHFSASYSSSVQLYYSAFPIVNTSIIQNTAVSFIHAFTGNSMEFHFSRLLSDHGNVILPKPQRDDSLDYSSLYQRYDLENDFLQRIKTGDVENVIAAEKRMTMQGFSDKRYVAAYYQDPSIGISMERAMARKAAEYGGASIVEIHKITQKAVQRIVSSRNIQDQIKENDLMILELTRAVRRSRMNLGAYTPPIRKAVEYLEHNFSQEIRLSDLAKAVNLSESYLSRTFKAETGSTVFQYIAYLRCREASELLRTTSIPISEISSYVGYEDNNYFVKVFKKQFNMTPSEYRRKEYSTDLSK